MSNLEVREAERGTGWRWVATAGGRRKSGRETTEAKARKAGNKALAQLQAMPPRQRSGKRVAPPGERFVVTFSGETAKGRAAWEAAAAADDLSMPVWLARLADAASSAGLDAINCEFGSQKRLNHNFLCLPTCARAAMR